jgi:hypothetical protein
MKEQGTKMYAGTIATIQDGVPKNGGLELVCLGPAESRYIIHRDIRQYDFRRDEARSMETEIGALIINTTSIKLRDYSWAV